MDESRACYLEDYETYLLGGPRPTHDAEIDALAQRVRIDDYQFTPMPSAPVIVRAMA